MPGAPAYLVFVPRATSSNYDYLTNRLSFLIRDTYREIRQFCRLQDEGQSLIRAAMTQLDLLASAYHRILKLAQTSADLAGSEEIQSAHLAEVLRYRPKIMMG